MLYKFFLVPALGTSDAERDLNDFVRAHRVLSVEKRWIERDSIAFWHFCVCYHEEKAAQAPPVPASTVPKKPRIDYREILSAEDFALFDRLRRRRKQIAESEAVPVYMIFNNEKLARMAQTRAASKSALEQIAGVGDARVEKYGERMLEILRGGSVDETQRQSA